MTRFTDRVEHDLSQISDRATPSSSTAWETIRQRIDEQDSRATSGTEPTVEVIMLDPDINKYSKRPRTGLLVAASIAAIALVGGLIVVANRDGERAPLDRPEPAPTVPATDPAIAGNPAPADEETAPVVVDPDLPPSTEIDADAVSPGESDSATGPEGEVLPQVEPISEGVFEPVCTDVGQPTQAPDDSRLIVQQTCELLGVDVQPFAVDQGFEVSLLANVGGDRTAAIGTAVGVFLGLGDDGFMNTGLLWDDGTKGRWVGIAEGIDEYEDTPVFMSSFGTQNADGSGDERTSQWWTNDGARPDFDEVEVTAEITFVCEPVQFTGTGSNQIALPGSVPGAILCSYDGDDPDLVPEPEQFVTTVVPASFGDESPGDGPGPVAFSDYLIGVSDNDDVLRAGLVTGGTDIRWSGMRRGTGVYEGQLVAENGWAAFDDPGSPDSSVTGVIQLTVLPADG